MPAFEFTSPDGKKYQVNGPEGATSEQAFQMLQKQIGAPAEAPATDSFAQRFEPAAPVKPTRAWSDIPGEALSNVGSSAVNFAKGVIHPFWDAPATAKTIFHDLPRGLVEKTGLADNGGKYSRQIDAIGNMVSDRYGGVENLKNTLATDPVGALSDASLLLSGGAALPARLPGVIGQVARGVGAVGSALDPLTAPIMAAKGAGATGSELVGGLLTHTGGQPIRAGYKAGQEGGEAGRAFRENMRDQAPMEDAVNAAREALANMRRERGAEYRASMTGVKADPTELDFAKIDDALVKASGVKVYKGQDLSPGTQAIREEMATAVKEWKALTPAEFHTVEGMDALKQKLGNIRDATQPNTPERVIADQIYQGVRKTIVDQAPEYAKVMKAYEEATKQLKDIEKTLSLTPNASIDTSLRKLQSTLRDNVNTSFGRRKELAQYLVEAGAPNLMERLAGQAMKPWTPRGLAKLLGGEIMAAGAGALGAGATGAGAGAVAALPLMSPRLVGEAAHAAGRASNLPLRATGRAAFQAGRLTEQLDPREMVRHDAEAALKEKGAFSKREMDVLRAAASEKAPIDTVMAAKRILEFREEAANVAAERTKRSVISNRKEGAATRVPENIAKSLVSSAANVVGFPARYARGETDYVPGELTSAQPQATNWAAGTGLGMVGSPGGVGGLGSGVRRPYEGVPDSLMGFRRNGPGKPFEQEKFRNVQFVRVELDNGDVFYDAIKGLNGAHAIERARRNWDAKKISPVTREEAFKAEPQLKRDLGYQGVQ